MCGDTMEPLGEDAGRMMLRGGATGASEPEKIESLLEQRRRARAAGLDLRKAIEAVGD
jgi:hypothetical protein